MNNSKVNGLKVNGSVTFKPSRFAGVKYFLQNFFRHFAQTFFINLS